MASDELGSGDGQVVLVGVNHSPFWPFGRTEHRIAIRDEGSETFEVSEMEKREFDKIIERWSDGEEIEV